jgi:hypothetical protein
MQTLPRNGHVVMVVLPLRSHSRELWNCSIVFRKDCESCYEPDVLISWRQQWWWRRGCHPPGILVATSSDGFFSEWRHYDYSFGWSMANLDRSKRGTNHFFHSRVTVGLLPYRCPLQTAQTGFLETEFFSHYFIALALATKATTEATLFTHGKTVKFNGGF